MSTTGGSAQGTVLVLDEPDVIRKKFKTAVTDSGREIRYAPDEKPGVSNLIEILSVATGVPIPEVEQAYDGKGYGDLKGDVGEAVVELVRADPGQVQGAARRRGRVAEAAAGRRRKGARNLRADARADVRADGVRPTVARARFVPSPRQSLDRGVVREAH